MTYARVLLVSAVGIGAIITGFSVHSHIAKVSAARVQHAVPPAPYFPPGSVWTQDISHAPLDPRSSEIIDASR